MAGNEPLGKMDSVLPNYFSGDLDLAKPRLICFLHFVRARGSGEESARAFGFIFSGVGI